MPSLLTFDMLLFKSWEKIQLSQRFVFTLRQSVVVWHLGGKRETVIPVELLKQMPPLFISPSILYNFFHSLSYFRRPNLSIFFPFLHPITKTYPVT